MGPEDIDAEQRDRALLQRTLAPWIKEAPWG
jgi:hypothetical protein